MLSGLVIGLFVAYLIGFFKEKKVENCEHEIAQKTIKSMPSLRRNEVMVSKHKCFQCGNNFIVIACGKQEKEVGDD